MQKDVNRIYKYPFINCIKKSFSPMWEGLFVLWKVILVLTNVHYFIIIKLVLSIKNGLLQMV